MEVRKMKKIILAVLMLALFFQTVPTSAQSMDQHVVKKGDTLWKIAMKYEIGVKEIIQANTQFKNPDLIYPNDIVYIPNIDATKDVETQVQSLVNEERKKSGLQPLEMDWELQRTARTKACDMADKGYFSHDSPTYGSPFDMMEQFGIKYKTAGENIAQGQTSAHEVMKSWMNSEGHRKNIMSGDYTHIGVGFCAKGNHWVQMFIGK
jgi:uncharacterized YkwD family protein/spore coat assembly protein SafA